MTKQQNGFHFQEKQRGNKEKGRKPVHEVSKKMGLLPTQSSLGMAGFQEDSATKGPNKYSWVMLLDCYHSTTRCQVGNKMSEAERAVATAADTPGNVPSSHSSAGGLGPERGQVVGTLQTTSVVLTYRSSLRKLRDRASSQSCVQSFPAMPTDQEDCTAPAPGTPHS